MFFDKWNHKTERTRLRRETVKSLDVLSVDLPARCYRVTPIKRVTMLHPGVSPMLLNTDVMIYAVYKHKRQHKPQEQFLKRVPTLAEAMRIEKRLFCDPAKAANLQRLIFRFHAIDRRVKV